MIYWTDLKQKKKTWQFFFLFSTKEKNCFLDILPEARKVFQKIVWHKLIPYEFNLSVDLWCRPFDVRVNIRINVNAPVHINSWWVILTHVILFIVPFFVHTPKKPSEKGGSKKQVKRSCPMGNGNVVADWLNQLPIKYDRLDVSASPLLNPTGVFFPASLVFFEIRCQGYSAQIRVSFERIGIQTKKQ